MMLVYTVQHGLLTQPQIQMLRFLGVRVTTYHCVESFRYIKGPDISMNQIEVINPTPKFERTRSKKAPRIW